MYRLILIALCVAFISCREHPYIKNLQGINFCDYFTLDTTHNIYRGKYVTGFSPKIISKDGGTVSEFISEHKERFEYLLNKSFVTFVKKRLPREHSGMKIEFCTMLQSKEFHSDFALLINPEKTSDTLLQNVFTPSDFMRVASRFFLCDGINKKGSSIGYHICIGINGQNELKSERDYTALEAISFEAIFSNFKKGNMLPEEKFKEYIRRATNEEKNNFTDFKSYLENVKNKCFAYIEKDQDMQSLLIKYYNANKQNISFKIR